MQLAFCFAVEKQQKHKFNSECIDTALQYTKTPVTRDP